MPTYRHRGEPCVSRDASGSILNPYLEAIILLNLAPTVGLRDRNGYLSTVRSFEVASLTPGPTSMASSSGSSSRGSLESFNGRFRDECLNQHWFVNLAGAQRTIEQWRQDYNTARPHSSLGNLTPAEFARERVA